MYKLLVVLLVIFASISVCYVLYKRSLGTIVEFTQQSSDLVEQVKTLLNLMFIETKFNITTFKSKLKILLEHVVTFSEKTQKVVLKMLNEKYKDVKAESIKNEIEQVYTLLIDEYVERSMDISCILNANSCSVTEIKGTCGTLVNKLKTAMKSETELKKYKEFVEDLKDLIEPLN